MKRRNELEEGDYIERAMNSFRLKVMNTKQNIIEFKLTFEKMNDNLRELNAKYSATVEIQELRNYQQSNIRDEVEKIEKKIVENRNKIDKLGLEKVEIEKENYFESYNIKQLEKEKNNLLNHRDELFTKRQYMEKEISLLKEKYNRTEKQKLENEIFNSRTLKDFDSMNKDISENNKKIIRLQERAKELTKNNKDIEDQISEYKDHHENTTDFNQILDEKIHCFKVDTKKKENEIFNIKKDLEDIKFILEEGKIERVHLSNKLERLIILTTEINNQNIQLNEKMKISLKSLKKNVEYLDLEAMNLNKLTEQRKKMISGIKEIISYQNVLD